MLDIDSFLGKQRFYRMSNKVIELWGIYISPRKLKYMHTVFKNYEKAYKKVKGGGKIVGGFSEHLYNNK